MNPEMITEGLKQLLQENNYSSATIRFYEGEWKVNVTFLPRMRMVLLPVNRFLMGIIRSIRSQARKAKPLSRTLRYSFPLTERLTAISWTTAPSQPVWKLKNVTQRPERLSLWPEPVFRSRIFPPGNLSPRPSTIRTRKHWIPSMFLTRAGWCCRSLWPLGIMNFMRWLPLMAMCFPIGRYRLPLTAARRLWRSLSTICRRKASLPSQRPEKYLLLSRKTTDCTNLCMRFPDFPERSMTWSQMKIFIPVTVPCGQKKIRLWKPLRPARTAQRKAGFSILAVTVWRNVRRLPAVCWILNRNMWNWPMRVRP